MKHIVFFTTFLCLSLACFTQTVQVTCNLNDTIAPKYKKDADRMAIRRAINKNTTYMDSLKPYAPDRDIYLKALIAVYNATAIPARDTVIRMCNIHTLDMPDMNRFIISADSILPWMVNLRNNVYPTGCGILDNAMQKYNMQRTQYNAYWATSWHTVQFKTDTNLNAAPIGYSLVTAYPGQVVGASPLCCVWDGPDILDSINANFTELYYFYRWWDCIDGCDLYQWWRFRVSNNCSVALLGSGGNSDLPPGLGINEKQLAFRDLKVYPNPATDRITVDFSSGTESIDKISLFNILGETIREITSPPKKQEIDLKQFESGMYYLKAVNEQGERVFKVLKE